MKHRKRVYSMKEYYDLYFFNGEEWLFTARFPMIDDRIHYSMIQEIEKITNLGFKWRFEYVEEKTK